MFSCGARCARLLAFVASMSVLVVKSASEGNVVLVFDYCATYLESLILRCLEY